MNSLAKVLEVTACLIGVIFILETIKAWVNKAVIVAFIFRNEMSCFCFSSFEWCILCYDRKQCRLCRRGTNPGTVIVLYIGYSMHTLSQRFKIQKNCFNCSLCFQLGSLRIILWRTTGSVGNKFKKYSFGVPTFAWTVVGGVLSRQCSAVLRISRTKSVTSSE